jgi:hypothetical protein
MSDPVIRRQLRCIQCGYDLEGLSARGACPECGRDIVASLAAQLDLAATDAEPSIEIRRSAWALCVAAFACLAGSARLPELAVRAALGELATNGLESLKPAAEGVATLLHLASIGGPAAGLLALAFVLPRRGERRVLRIRGLGCAGFALWLAIALPAPNAISVIATTIPAGLVLLALGPLLRELGPRSRIYRSRESAKQRIDELLFALGTAGIAAGCATLALSSPTNETLALLLYVVAAASAGLFLIGCCYLAVNALWILRAVLRPDPTLAELLGASDSSEKRLP